MAHSPLPPIERSSSAEDGVESVVEIKPIRVSIKGRGTAHRPQGRFETVDREAIDDGWPDVDEIDADGAPAKLRTEVAIETAKTIISRNQSPDLPFSQSINPYRGCEHGCIYCFARPTHAYLGMSPGLDFETKLIAKTNAAELLRKELAAPRYKCGLIAMGTNTDPYQPIERKYGITRQIIEVLAECNHPLGIVTKGALIERDIDLLAPMAAKGLVQVFFSVTSLDHDVARRLDPRASAPARRLQAISTLAAVGIPVGVLASPVIPLITDTGFEAVLRASREAGATRAGYSVLRLPHEVNGLFQDWLQRHYPLRAEHVMSQLRQMRGGRDNDPKFGSRIKGEGIFAELIRKRFDVACRKLGFDLSKRNQLDTSQFVPPATVPAPKKITPQLDLF
jgi:DNA repair photolyase